MKKKKKKIPQFRDYLVPASGFQSFQFRQIEILMGVDESKRVECNGSHVFNALQPDQKEQCEGLITEGRSIRNIVENLLLSVDLPSNFMEKYYEGMEELQLLRQQGPAHHTEEKAKVCKLCYFIDRLFENKEMGLTKKQTNNNRKWQKKRPTKSVK